MTSVSKIFPAKLPNQLIQIGDFLILRIAVATAIREQPIPENPAFHKAKTLKNLFLHLRFLVLRQCRSTLRLSKKSAA